MVRRIQSSGLGVLILALSLVVLVLPLAIAADSVPPGKLATLELDPAKTTITYSLEGWPHHTQGTFTLKHGVIRIDPQTGKMDGVITVDAASGNSGHSVRDERMKSSVLEVSRFPEISFAPRQVVSHGNAQGEFPVTVRGLMSLHGAQHEFPINAVVSREGNNVTIHCNFVIPYVEWGLEDPSILMFKVSKEVHVDVTMNARLSWIPSTAMPTAYFQRIDPTRRYLPVGSAPRTTLVAPVPIAPPASSPYPLLARRGKWELRGIFTPSQPPYPAASPRDFLSDTRSFKAKGEQRT